MTTRRKLVFTLLLVFLSLLLPEIALHLLCAVSRKIDAALLSEKARAPVVLDDRLLYGPNPANPDHDPFGYRNRSRPATISVLALGDSQTYGTGVDSKEAWPAQLAAQGNLSTYNMGIGGWGPAQYLMVAPQAVSLKPELIVVALFTGNDLYDAYSMVYERNQLPELRSTDPSVLSRIRDAESVDPFSRKFASPVTTQASKKHSSPFFRRYCKLYCLFVAARKAFTSSPPDTEEAAWEKDVRWAKANDVNPVPWIGGPFRTIFTPGSRFDAMNLEDVRIAEGFRITLEVVRRIRDLASAQGTKVAVLCISTKEMAFRAPVKQSAAEGMDGYWRQIRAEEILRDRLKNEIETAKVEFLDSLPAVEESLSKGRLPFFKSRDGHLNSEGQRAVAECVLGEIQKRKLLSSGK